MRYAQVSEVPTSTLIDRPLKYVKAFGLSAGRPQSRTLRHMIALEGARLNYADNKEVKGQSRIARMDLALVFSYVPHDFYTTTDTVVKARRGYVAAYIQTGGSDCDLMANINHVYNLFSVGCLSAGQTTPV